MSVECLEVLVIHAARPKLTCLLLPILINTVALCTKVYVIPLKISAQKSTFTTVFLTFFGFRRRDRRTDFRWHRVTFSLDSERNYPSLLWLQSRENEAFLPLPLDARKLKGFQLQGGFAPWPPDQRLCPWTLLGAPPQTPVLGSLPLVMTPAFRFLFLYDWSPAYLTYLSFERDRKCNPP